MNQYQLSQKLKLTNSIIRTSNSLSSFLSSYSYSYMSFHYHWYIVSSISNRKSNPFSIFLCQSYNIWLLFWRYSTTNHWVSLTPKFKKPLSYIYFIKNQSQSKSINHNAHFLIKTFLFTLNPFNNSVCQFEFKFFCWKWT